MRIDWVPFSASALVAGATALSVGAILLPRTEDSADLIRAVEQDSGLWLAVAFLYFFASALLTIGMPSVITLFDRKGMRTALSAVGVFTLGCVGIAGFAMLLGFIQALVLRDAIEVEALDKVTTETGFAVLLFGWIVAFYLGELLLAVALLRAGSAPTWIPVLFLAHIASAVLPAVVPDLPGTIQTLTALLVTVALSGVGITANNRHATLA